MRLGSGILGGAMVNGANQGERAADLAIEILRGRTPEEIPPVSEKRNKLYIDWEVLKDFSFPHGGLTKEVHFLNRPEGFFEFYRRYVVWIWIVAILLVVETGMLILLSIVNRQRRIAYRRRREAEERMIHSEKMVSVGGLAAGVAHEINNPLSGILQNIQLIESRLEEENPKNSAAAREAGLELPALHRYVRARGIDEMADFIRSSAQSASTIVKDMLYFSRREYGSNERFSVSEMVEEVLSLASKDYNLKKHPGFRGIEIERNYREPLPLVYGSKGKLEQVLFNLLRNAADAMERVTEQGRKPKIVITLRAVEGNLVIELADNGKGMDNETQRRIFEPFFTTKGVGEGTGLGLFVSYSIVTEQHGGKMTVESSEGEGTRFRVFLPIKTDED